MNNTFRLPINKYTSQISEIINEKFDLSWFKDNYVKHQTMCESEIKKGVVDDGSVNYYYNTESFRCDEFKKDHDGLHILFAGCSETEGIGGNIEDAWPSILLSQMKSKNSGFFNIGRSGYGWEMIVHNSLIYFDKYGTPDYMFILLPNIGRNFKWSAFGSPDYSYIQQYCNELKNNNKNLNEPDLIFKMNKTDYFESLIRFLIGWRTFINLCYSLNIKLYWSSWYYNDLNNLETINMFNFNKSNYVKLGRQNESNYISDKWLKNGKRKHDLDKRDGHSGLLIHEYWANSFIERVKKDNENF